MDDSGGDVDVLVVERPEDLCVEGVLLSRDVAVDLFSLLEGLSTLAEQTFLPIGLTKTENTSVVLLERLSLMKCLLQMESIQRSVQYLGRLGLLSFLF